MRFTSAVEFVKRLQPEHLQSFWFFASKINLAIIGTFGSILWATSEASEDCEFYRLQLVEYRWTLRVSSNAAEFMKYTVTMLDESPVFMTDEELGVPERASQTPVHHTEDPRTQEPVSQGDISNSISNTSFDFSNLNDNQYWLDYATSGLDSHTENSGQAMGTAGKTPTESWAYNFENISGGNDFPGLQSSGNNNLSG